MTIKELADFTGKNETTVARWAKKSSCKMQKVEERLENARKTGVPADFSIDEVEIILQSGSLSKDAVTILMKNARENNTPALLEIKEDKSFEMMAAAFKTLADVVKMQESRLQNIEAKIEKRAALLPAPQISTRKNVTKLVNEYAEREEIEFRAVYSILYREFNYRMNMNVDKRAKNRNMSKMDYIDAEGLIGQLEAIAIEIFKEA